MNFKNNILFLAFVNIWHNIFFLFSTHDPRMLCADFVEIGPVVLEKKMKMWKVYSRTDRQTDGQTTDDRWSEKLTWAFSSGELKTTDKNFYLSFIIMLSDSSWINLSSNAFSGSSSFTNCKTSSLCFNECIIYITVHAFLIYWQYKLSNHFNN